MSYEDQLIREITTDQGLPEPEDRDQSTNTDGANGVTLPANYVYNWRTMAYESPGTMTKGTTTGEIPPVSA